jgi:hypothetical protein
MGLKLIKRMTLILGLLFTFSCDNLYSISTDNTKIDEVNKDVLYSSLVRNSEYLYFNNQDIVELTIQKWSHFNDCINYQIESQKKSIDTLSFSMLVYMISSTGEYSVSCSFETDKDSIVVLDNSLFSASHLVYLYGYQQDSNGVFGTIRSDSLIFRNGNRLIDTILTGIDSTGKSYSFKLDSSKGEFSKRTFLLDSIKSFKRVSEKICDIEHRYCDIEEGVDTLWSRTPSNDSLKSDTLEWVFSPYCSDGKPICRSKSELRRISFTPSDSLYEYKKFYTQIGLLRGDCSRDEIRQIKNKLNPNSSSAMGIWGLSYSIEFSYFEMNIGEENCLGMSKLDTINLGL